MNAVAEPPLSRQRGTTLALCGAAGAALVLATAAPLLGWLVGGAALAAIAWRAWQPAAAAPASPPAALEAGPAPALPDGVRQRRLAVLGRLAPGVAHDFNNVLGVLSNSIYLFERHAGNPPPQALQTPLAAAQRAVKNGSRLTGQLQRFAEHRDGNPRPLVLPVELQEVAELVRTALGRRFELALAIAPDARRALGDTAALELALAEAALDVRQTLPSGAKLRLDARNDGEQVCIALVRDEAPPETEPLAALRLPVAPPA